RTWRTAWTGIRKPTLSELLFDWPGVSRSRRDCHRPGERRRSFPSSEVTVFKHPSSTLVGMVFLSLLVAGCSRVPDLPPVIGSEGQSMAKTAFEQILEALESGNEDKVWEGLSARSQSRIKETFAAERTAERGKKSLSEQAKAVEVLRGIVGRKP